MRKIKIHPGVKAGETVWNGFIGGQTTCTAPKEPGTYTLYELADDNNCHAGWIWEKEGGEVNG